ncbi:formate/nitrite transporter family protein [Salinimicrobium soli]|uniref:formate/nitrite transporter family protein n=1 Tax=Salinimicrobium soli TaxID=1254399 RepID=UPI003AAE9A4D
MSGDKDQEKKNSTEAKERQSPSAQIVHDTIFAEAETELNRPTSALFWSALAAGLSMGISMIAEALLTVHLPDTEWRPLITNFGYSLGFLIVILGRQQLFTENILTPILPLLHRKDFKTFKNVGRLWGTVFIGNLLGTFCIALVAIHTDVFETDIKLAFLDLGREALKPSFLNIFLGGIFAGWLIALLVWLLPFAETARVWVIIIITYIIGVGSFSHVIAGSTEVFSLLVNGDISTLTTIMDFLLPTLLGNVLGGVLLVAVLNHAQTVAGEEDEAIDM